MHFDTLFIKLDGDIDTDTCVKASEIINAFDFVENRIKPEEIIEKDLLPQTGRKHTNSTPIMLSCIDVLVDGPFIKEEKNISLAFRGSENQRIIKLSSKNK